MNETHKLIDLVLRLNNAHSNACHFKAMAWLKPECAVHLDNALMTYRSVLADLKLCVGELPEELK